MMLASRLFDFRIWESSMEKVIKGEFKPCGMFWYKPTHGPGFYEDYADIWRASGKYRWVDKKLEVEIELHSLHISFLWSIIRRRKVYYINTWTYWLDENDFQYPVTHYYGNCGE